jgi:hypothetical protein
MSRAAVRKTFERRFSVNTMDFYVFEKCTATRDASDESEEVTRERNEAEEPDDERAGSISLLFPGSVSAVFETK